MLKVLFALWSINNLTTSMPQKSAYQIFSQEGNSITYEEFLSQSQEADIILFGELHNNPICHWLELELTKSLFQAKGKQLRLGGEIFEADDQVILDEYWKGLIAENHFENEAKLWNNYTTDYKPILNFGLTHQIPFIATNIPRRYASLVAKQGLTSLENLSEEAKNWIAPLPIEVDLTLPGYANMLEMMGGHGSGMSAENFAHAQAIKDATMAHFILENLERNQTFLHLNGAYHSNNFEGIVWYLQKQNPDLKTVTISSVEQAEVNSLSDENKGIANFIIAIPHSMIKTY